MNGGKKKRKKEIRLCRSIAFDDKSAPAGSTGGSYAPRAGPATRGHNVTIRHLLPEEADSCAWLTCESDLDQVQRMQHQSWDDAAGDTRDEIFILEVIQDIELARRTRRTATLYRRHIPRWHAIAPLAIVRYRSVVGGNRFRILANANNARLHSAAYLLIRGRHCRRAVVASHVAEIRPRAAQR